MATAVAAPYEIIVEPRRGPFSVDWRALWQYRDLIVLFARLDYVTRFKQTLLGPIWYVAHPLLTSLVFVGVFTGIVNLPSDGIPPILFYLCGLVAWNYFAQCLSATAVFLTQNSHIFRKVYIPRLAIPFSIALGKLVPFGLQLALFAAAYALVSATSPGSATFRPTWAVALVPLLAAQMALLGIGVGLCFATLSVRYRDLQQVVGLFTQLWLYATPIIYPAGTVPHRWRAVVALNPMAAVVGAFRYAFFGTAVSVKYLALSSATTVAIFLLGLVLFHQVEGTLADTL